jgi:hypothetical protein
MTISWYSISISIPYSSNEFKGFFSVNNINNVVQSFYQTIRDEYHNEVTNFTTNLLVDAGTRTIPGSRTWSSNNNNTDNIFSSLFSANGTIFRVTTPFNWQDFDVRAIGLVTQQDGPFITNKAFLLSTAIGQNDFRAATFDSSTLLAYDPSSVCFNEGTKILCLNKELLEEYIRIENLRKGDIVKSYKHGYRKIDLIGKNPMINNPEKFNKCMYKMEKTKENGLIEDLIVTGGHSILVDDLGENKEENEKIFKGTQMIDDKYLLLSAVSKDFKKLENNNLYIYYHFILENDGNNEARYGVWANGILTETPNKNLFMGIKFTLLENK